MGGEGWMLPRVFMVYQRVVETEGDERLSRPFEKCQKMVGSVGMEKVVKRSM